jgi:Mg-chelatase subunit ChlD
MSIAIKPFKNAPLGVQGFYEKTGGIWKTHVRLTPPATGEQQGQFYTLIFDTSGSMGTDACQVGDDATNFHTRMDLLKVVAELMVKMLGHEDIVYLVGFSDNGVALLPPTKMTDTGKASALAAIQRMTPGGSTNLWNSIEIAQAEMAKALYAEIPKHAIMLTDGDESYPAASHPAGTTGAFATLPRTFALNVLGFGASVTPDMLAKLTEISGGRFSNVADFTTLPTTSINTLATIQATCSMDQTVFVTYADGTTSNHKTSFIQYGQDRNIVFETQKQPVSVATSRSTPVPFTEGLSPFANCRLELLTAIRKTIESGGLVNMYTGVHRKYSDTEVATHVSEINPVDGELVKALENADTWKKWGSKYSYAYLQALENDHRMNFREKGQAHLGGAAFERFKVAGDEVFSSIPKPRPSGASTRPASSYYGGYTAPAIRTVAGFANTNDPAQFGGCWAPNSMVLMADGSRKAIELVEPDDMVWTTTGSKKVDYTFAFGTYLPAQNMCRVGGLLATWYHPVYVGGKWQFPRDLAPIETLAVPIVHNMMLSAGGGSVVDIDGTLTICLGHELQEDVVKHAFFGSRQAILDSIKDRVGRRISFVNLISIRDPSSGVIIGWKDLSTA